jgi:hypothetical protein
LLKQPEGGGSPSLSTSRTGRHHVACSRDARWRSH